MPLRMRARALVVAASVAAFAPEAVAECEASFATSGVRHPSARETGEGFGMRRHPLLGDMRLHAGIDYRGPIGDPVVAASPGRVKTVGVDGAYGNRIVVDHGAGFETSYSHLSRFGVALGACVAAGTPIGSMGTTGLSAEPHLHFEVIKDGRTVDPSTFLPAR